MNKLTAVWRGNAAYNMFQLQMDAQAHLQGLYFQNTSTISQLVEVPTMAMTPKCNPRDAQGALPLSGGPTMFAYHGRSQGWGQLPGFPFFSSETCRCSIKFNHV